MFEVLDETNENLAAIRVGQGTRAEYWLDVTDRILKTTVRGRV
jgi:hypothetical protein